MIKISVLIVAAVMLFGCSGKKVKKVYFGNGKLKEEYEVAADTIVDGHYKSYYDNGSIFLNDYYKNGKLEGRYLAHYPNGVLMAKRNYKNDKIEDEALYYFANGKLEQKGKYLNGLPNGLFQTYYSNGNLNEVTLYTHDSVIRTEYYDSLSGKLIGIATSATVELGSKKYRAGDSLRAKIHVNDMAHFRDVRVEVGCFTWQQYLDYQKGSNLILVERRPFINDYIYSDSLKAPGHYIVIVNVVYSDTLSSDRQVIEIKKEFDVKE